MAAIAASDESEIDQQVEVIQQFSQDRKKQVVIVMAGKSGVGKSTLINTFLRLEGSEASESRLQSTSVTETIDYREKIINSVNVRIIDMPGLHASERDKQKDEQTLVDLKVLTEGQADVLFYCVKIIDRIDKIDWENIDTLTKMFGEDIWNHAVVVFTWTDIAIFKGYNLHELIENFVRTMKNGLEERKIKTQIRSVYSFDADMLSEDAEINAYNGIVAVPVSDDPASPPEWRTTLLLQVIRKCKQENISAFLQLYYNFNWKEFGKSALITAVAGGTGAVVGTGIGAAIGAAIGGALTAPIGGVGAIPTAAGGAALGCWIGTLTVGGSTATVTGITRSALAIRKRCKLEQEARRKIKSMIKQEKNKGTVKSTSQQT